MSLETQHFYDFGDFRIDLAEKVLLRDGKFIPVTPKVFETLCVLVENAGRVIEKDELIQKIWQDRFVEESNLTFNVGMLRKALGDDAAKPTFIETVPRRGYRFIAEVTRVAGDGFQTNGDYKIFSSNGHAANGHAINSNGADLLNGNSLDETRVADAPTRPNVFSRPLVYLIALILIGGSSLAGFFLWQKQPSFYDKFGSSGAGFLGIEKMSEAGNIVDLNISPDGRLITYNTQDNGKNILWIRQIATGKSIPLLTATDEIFHGTGFSRDGEFVFYTHRRNGETLVLSRVSTLGGTPTRILEGLHNGWTFSPDGKQIAFDRYGEQGSRLMIADADGRNEREVFLSPKPRYMSSLAWSPDGKSIAYCIGSGRFDGGGADSGIYEFNLADGAEKPLTEFKWNYLEKILWLPDRSGLLATAREKLGEAEQIWRVPLSGGRPEPITGGASALKLRGASADFSRILTNEQSLESSVWIASKDNLNDVRPVTKAEFDVDWTPDGKLIFPSKDTMNSDIWLANGNGDDKRQLTVNDALERSPLATPDKRFVIYVSTQNGPQNIWRMNADGSSPIALTDGEGESFPTITPDGRFVVYIANKDKSLWRVPIEGGAAEQISAERHRRVSISPDGTKLAHLGRVNNQPKLIIESYPACAPLQQLDANFNEVSYIRIVWAQDGKSVIYYANDTSLVGNLWRQSLDGGEPQKLTNFTSERIFDFAFSPDGSQIAFVRGDWKNDAVLLKGFK